MKESALLDYARERESLTLDQIHFLLDRGIELASRTGILSALSKGGSALFPHTYIQQCGDQIAAAVHASLAACQITGKNQILLIGVLHPLIDELKESRKQEMAGRNIFGDPSRGIFGPGLPREDLLEKEFSLDHFLFLLEHYVNKYHIELPKVIIRYPNLIYGQPESLPGIKELKKLANESVVVATSDLCHYGVAYGHSLPQGVDFASRVVENNLRLLAKNDLLAYRQYCLDTLSDSLEVGQLLNTLLGPIEGQIHDLRLIDVSELFDGNPQPSWVAASLVELRPIASAVVPGGC